ncbi:lactococcin 972 family bacteriocin [Streptomyces sp. NPDC048521]|uniref:lactococcin 972 family bacteriocin n=1 Tax=Streptomyces sp. NPDC048521 TaxID=3365566 RepID=UPI003715A52F
MDDSTVTPQACINASGGNWCYGYNLTANGKYCYSNYYHPTKMHHSTVKISGARIALTRSLTKPPTPTGRRALPTPAKPGTALMSRS